MRVLNLIIFFYLIGGSWCGLILHNIRDSLHSKIYGHGLHGDTKQNSPIISVNNQQQVILTADHTNQYQQQQHGLNQRGDYGSLANGGEHHSYGGALNMDSNFKAGGTKYYQGGNPYDAHHLMKQDGYHNRNGHKFGHHHDNNMFGNSQSVSNGGGTSSSSASSSSSSSSSSASASSSSSSSSFSNGERPWIRRY